MINDASQWLLALERERDELGDLRYRYSALYSAVRFLLEEERGIPMTATNDAKARNALNEVVTNGEWTDGEQCGDWKISKAVYEMAVEARDMLDILREAPADEGERTETLRTILDLLNPLHGSLDKQTYDERLKENFDAPRDAEYAVNVTAQQERDLTQAVLIIESRLAPHPAPHEAASSTEIAEIKARRAKISATPWVRSGIREKLRIEDALTIGPDGKWFIAVPIGKSYKDQAGAIADAEFIAHAPTDIDTLLSKLAELEGKAP